MSKALSTLAALLAAAGFASAGFAEDIAKNPSTSMTSDPAINHTLERYTRPLPDKNQETIRTIMLSRLLSTGCVGVTADKQKLDAYTAASGLFKLPTQTAKEASRFASAEFDYFDYDALTHLCAGSDYLFGSHGVLLKNAMSKGSMKVKFTYDPANPYFKVRPFLPE